MDIQSKGTIPDGYISDYIDGVPRRDTPEEYVRQTIEKRLIIEHKYLASQVQVEYALHVGANKPRADLVIWEKGAEHLQTTAKIIIECKRESVESSGSQDGIAQLQSYMSVCPNCDWGMWTNSKEKYVFHKLRDEAGNIAFEEYNDIPSANGDLDTVNRPTRESLRNATDDNLLFVFRTCHNYIYTNDGLQKQGAFFELLKVIFCKTEDEKAVGKPLEFYTTSKERGNTDGQLTVQKRIGAIFDKVKKRQGKIFDVNDRIKLSPRSLAYIVGELQVYNLLNTNIDIKGKAYEEIVGANLRGDRGEFFTPRNVMKMTVGMINPTETEKVLDSSCGTGGFIVAAMTHVMDKIEEQVTRMTGKPKSEWDIETMMNFRTRISEIAGANFFGFDLNPDLAKATKMNMVMNNDGSGNIFQTNSLLPPHEWSDDFKARLAEALYIDKDEIRNYATIGYFDVIVTNPPFGSKIPIKDTAILEQFELAHIWHHAKGSTVWNMTERLQSSVPPEILFIERCTQLLVPGGRLGIVVPDSIVNAPSMGYIRQWILKNHRIIACIKLHADTFQPKNGTQTSVMILQKKTDAQKISIKADYNIFMATIEHIGHDRRGNPLFVCDEDGNEKLYGEHKTKLLNDQTLLVPDMFAEWKRHEGIAW